jgi:hypothetical protein
VTDFNKKKFKALSSSNVDSPNALLSRDMSSALDEVLLYLIFGFSYKIRKECSYCSSVQTESVLVEITDIVL